MKKNVYTHTEEMYHKQDCHTPITRKEDTYRP